VGEGGTRSWSRPRRTSSSRCLRSLIFRGSGPRVQLSDRGLRARPARSAARRRNRCRPRRRGRTRNGDRRDRVGARPSASQGSQRRAARATCGTGLRRLLARRSHPRGKAACRLVAVCRIVTRRTGREAAVDLRVWLGSAGRADPADGGGPAARPQQATPLSREAALRSLQAPRSAGRRCRLNAPADGR
jgi:hypothetical protein